jgi:hypothetical protein
VLVVVMAIVTLADPLWCADGCRDRPITAGHQPNVSGGSDDCLTCQVPLSATVILPLQPTVKPIGAIAVSDESSAALAISVRSSDLPGSSNRTPFPS